MKCIRITNDGLGTEHAHVDRGCQGSVYGECPLKGVAEFEVKITKLGMALPPAKSAGTLNETLLAAIEGLEKCMGEWMMSIMRDYSGEGASQ